MAPVKNHQGIEVNFDSSNQTIKVKAKEPLEKIAEYKASCKNRAFHLELSNDEKLQTVFHAFSLGDGKKKIRKLSEREKLIKILESHMDVEVQN